MKFTIPIVPTAQMRTRHGVVKGFSRTYKDPKQARREESLMAMLNAHQPEAPLAGPLLLGVRAFMPMPKGVPESWKDVFKGRGAKERFRVYAIRGAVRPVVKPDLDNLLKHVKDCLTMMRFWEDDKQVVGYLPHTGKYYSDRPRWEIEIARMTWKP